MKKHKKIISVITFLVLVLLVWLFTFRQIDTNKASSLYAQLDSLNNTGSQSVHNGCTFNQSVFGGEFYCQTKFEVSYANTQLPAVINKLESHGFTETVTYENTASNDGYLFNDYSNGNEVLINPWGLDASGNVSSWHLFYVIDQFDTSLFVIMAIGIPIVVAVVLVVFGIKLVCRRLKQPK